ncbi:MAP2B [Symbiodinium natans]|uniref:MAP2B protein n=1 Tax=Symbiodinium natans TaxID=878477 RepID=A0A812UD40_9DINO|nr:MAP2B [Symbiodinium natans]
MLVWGMSVLVFWCQLQGNPEGSTWWLSQTDSVLLAFGRPFLYGGEVTSAGVVIEAVSFLLIALSLAGYFLPELTKESAFLPRLIPPEQLGLAKQFYAVAVYVLCFLAVVRWIWTQGRAARAENEELPHISDYALMAEGFPKSARSPHEVKAFFESILGFEVEGVSIAYDLSDEAEFVESRVLRVVEQADAHLSIYPAELADVRELMGSSQDGHVLDCLASSGQAVVVFSREEDREFCIRRFAEIRRQLRQNEGKVSTEEADTDDESQALLGGSRPSQTLGGLKEGRGRSSAARLSASMLFRGKFPITVSEAPDPADLLWKNFQVQGGLKLTRVVLTLIGGVLMVFVVSAVIFAPSVLAGVSYLDITGPSLVQVRLKWLEQVSMAGMTAVLNRVLAMSVRSAAEASGFVQKVSEDSVFLVCTYLMVIANSVAPLGIAQIVAASSDMRVTPELATEWLLSLMIVILLTTEFLYIVYPAWSYWSGHFRVRQSKYITVREGQPALTSAEFPLAQRYVDVLLVMTLMFVMIAIDYKSIYTIGSEIIMLFYSFYIFFIDKFFFLRINRQTYYVSSKLDLAVHYLFTVPMFLLAWFPLQFFDSWLPPNGWSRYAAMAAATAGTMLLFMATVRICECCNDPQRELSDVPYVEVASITACNYFNTNHAHVLRTLHFPSIVVPPVYPHLPGKEYLNGGQFADHDDSVHLRETLMLLAKSPFTELDTLGNPQDLT